MALTLRSTKGSQLSHDEADTNFTDSYYFIASGSGATQRTVREKLRDVVSVKDFGALGDGSTDDTATIQNAEDALDALGGGTLYWPVGTYIISSAIQKKRGVHWYGEGILNIDTTTSAAILKLADNADSKMVVTPSGLSGSSDDATHYMAIENIVFDGNRDAQSRAAEFAAVDFRGAFFPATLRRVFIRNVYGPGLLLGLGGDVELDHIWIYQCVTDDYALSHNLGFATNSGVMSWNKVFVEYTSLSTGYAPGEGAAQLQTDPTRRGSAIYIGNPVVCDCRSVFIEAAQPAITVSGGECVNLGHVRANYFGNNTNGDVVKITTAPQIFLSSYIRGRNASAGTLNLIEAAGAGAASYPDVPYSATFPHIPGYRSYNPSFAVRGYDNFAGDAVSTDHGNANGTLTVGQVKTHIWNTVLTADRSVTLSTTGAQNGDWFRIIRTANATGAFNLNVGTGPLKAMGTAGSYSKVIYDGSAWILAEYAVL